MSRHIYYNATNRFYQGNYAKLETAWNRFRDWQAAWHAVGAGSGIDPEREWSALRKRNVRLVLQGEDGYPHALAETARAPFGLYRAGGCDFSRPAVAIVGTRRATAEGLATARQFAERLAAQGIIIVSGLALGIDAAAHAGALDAGARGATVAVLPCGLDDVYPRTHTNLAQSIIATGGTLVSEYPFGTAPFPAHFLERNRIVAGIARGTLVVEAPNKSGALVTAKLAVEANREVLAVPGPVRHPNYAGPHALIREGAALVTCPEDVCEALGLLYQKSGPEPGTAPGDLSPEERAVVDTIRNAGKPLTVDAIAQLSTLEIPAVSRAVALLSVSGTLTELDGRYSL